MSNESLTYIKELSHFLKILTSHEFVALLDLSTIDKIIKITYIFIQTLQHYFD